jgi:universal stress protein A
MKSKPAKLSPLKTILVPCDFSDCSRAALEYATIFSKQADGTLVLLHVIEPIQPGFLIEGAVSRQTQGRMRERAGHELAAWASRCAGGAKVGRPLVKSGKPWEVIVSVASKTGADIILIGTHGYTGLKHAMLGSVAERVVRHAPCPVLTVRPKSKR